MPKTLADRVLALRMEIKNILELPPSPIERWQSALFLEAGVELWVKRDDLLFPKGIPHAWLFGGNKIRKLKLNLLEAQRYGHDTLLTFGGAFSNHIAATAAVGHAIGWHTIGIIRGERVLALNPTLAFAKSSGMQLEFVTRSDFRQKNHPEFIGHLRRQFGTFYLLPEGGTNLLAVNGVAEITAELESQLTPLPDYLCVAAGTGGTAAGIIAGLAGRSQVLVFPVLRGGFMAEAIAGCLDLAGCGSLTNWQVVQDYHFGGYARWRPELLQFLAMIRDQFGVDLDPVYTGKLFFGVFDLARKGFFPKGSSILVVHTGGQQGIEGFRQRFGVSW
jgi:1-aminocyclopropane-1-carboxylate deaminase/D-cysteine desulfhydrase-like pyridoxal-dependent ACC family enzyme